MTDNTVIMAGALVAGAILLHGYLGKSEERYQLSAAGTGQTVWRMDTRSGQISLCGSILDGGTFSKMQAQRNAAILNAVQNPSQDAQTKVTEDAEQFQLLAEPRCTEWTTD